MAKPTITLLRAVLVAVLALCLWTSAEAKAVAGGIVDPSGSHATFGVTLGGDPNMQY